LIRAYKAHALDRRVMGINRARRSRIRILFSNLMNRSRFLSLAVWLLAAAISNAQSFSIGGDDAPKQPLVTAELITAVTAAAPGQPFQAAVKLVHAKDSHTYGKVLPPEIIGKPTKLIWTLPEGWKVEELPWPATRSRCPPPTER
jgi:DsbC/DsbD-like thiol-disulfide interchange protein